MYSGSLEFRAGKIGEARYSDIILGGKNLGSGVPDRLFRRRSLDPLESAHHGFELIGKPHSVEALSRILRKAIPDRSSRG